MINTIFDELYNINREMNRLFGSYNYSNEYWAKTNVYETNNGYVIVSKLPGVKKR